MTVDMFNYVTSGADKFDTATITGTRYAEWERIGVPPKLTPTYSDISYDRSVDIRVDIARRLENFCTELNRILRDRFESDEFKITDEEFRQIINNTIIGV